METVLDAVAAELQRFKSREVSAGRRAAPFVCVTYAQSSDRCIAAAPGVPTAISCKESMTMTHGLRARFDGILVGVGTVAADNPSLTTRLVEGPSPQPIVIDPHLRLPLTCKLLTDSRCRKPILLSAWPSAHSTGEAEAEAWHARAEALTAAAARLLFVPTLTHSSNTGQLDLRAAMRMLRLEAGIGSVMVEGGAGTLRSFLQQHVGLAGTSTSTSTSTSTGEDDGGDTEGTPLVHYIVVTTSPVVLGPAGLKVRPAPAVAAAAASAASAASAEAGQPVVPYVTLEGSSMISAAVGVDTVTAARVAVI